MSEARKTVVADAHWIEPYPDRVADLPSGRYEARLWSYTDGSRALEISPLPENVGKHGVWSGRSLHFTKPADLLRCVACGGVVSTDRNLGDMTDQRDTPDPGEFFGALAPTRTLSNADTTDTRTPSAEGCGHSAHATDEDGRRVGADGGVLPTRTMRWELCPLPGQGSDAPSAPNRAPTDEAQLAAISSANPTLGAMKARELYDRALTGGTADRDALVERAKEVAARRGPRSVPYDVVQLLGDYRGALEDLTRENERLRAALDARGDSQGQEKRNG